MSQTLFEKLQYKEEKNVLIQGLPSAIEKLFVKMTFSKNVTPLLKNKKIDFALVFALNGNQLNTILKEVLPALHNESKLWISYPKSSSKIVCDLNRDCSWDMLKENGYETVRQVAIDNVWSALRFKKEEMIPVITRASANNGVATAAEGVDTKKRTVSIPEDLLEEMKKNAKAEKFFETLSFTNKKEFVTWINTARKPETRLRRVSATLEKLVEGKKNPSEK